MIWFITYSPDVVQDISQAVVHVQGAQTPNFIPPDVWPPNSPDLNSVNYSVWSIMQEKVYHTHISTS